MRRKRIWFAAFLLLALVVSLPWLLRLTVFHRPVRAAFERQLGRSVEFRTLTAQLLPRPALVARGFVLHAQEGFGAEPFLYAEEVVCAFPAAVLWRWRFECAQVNFLQPSINLARADDQAWNLAAFLLEPSAGKSDGSGVAASRPIFSVTEGRINFKSGADKLIYALTDVRLRLAPLAEGGWQVQLDATPLRTDRRLSEIGRLRLQGQVESAQEFSDLRFQMQVGLERGSLAQWVALVTGGDPGVRAEASLTVRFEGTPVAWSAQGKLTLADLRRWDLLASQRTPRWDCDFAVKGKDGWDTIEIEEFAVRSRQSEINFTGAVRDLFGQPQWNLQATSSRLVLDEMLGQFASLKSNVPDGTRLDGVAQLELVVRGGLPQWEGKLTSAEPMALRIPGRGEPVPLSGLNLELSRGQLVLQPLTMEFSPGNALAVSGTWQPGRAPFTYRVRWQSESVDLSSLEQMAAAFGWRLYQPDRWEGQAALDLVGSGDARNGWAVRWRGRLELSEAKFYPPEFNQALSIPQAHLLWSRRGLRVDPLVLQLGEDQIIATLQRPSRDAQWTVNATAARLDVAALDELLNPGRRSLLTRLVQSGRSPQREWKELSLQGALRVDDLRAGPFRLRRLRTQAEWREGKLFLTRLRFRAYGGRFAGRLQGDFLADPPKYRLEGNLRKINVHELLVGTSDLGELLTGLAGADVVLDAAGTRARQFVRSLEGRIVGVLRDGEMRSVNLLAAMAAANGPEQSGDAVGGVTRLQSLGGDFRIAGRQVELDQVRAIVTGAALELTGRVGFDGRMDLQLRGQPLLVEGRRPSPAAKRLLALTYRLTGTLRRPQVQLAPPPPTTGDTP